jgi:protein TonB
MFEQASIDTQGALRSPWALTFSVVGQSLAITAGVLISLVHTDALPRTRFYATLTPPGVSTDPPRPKTRSAEIQTVRESSHPFVAPASIPASLALESQSVRLSPPEGIGGSDQGVPGGIGPATGLSADFLYALPHPPAPPPRTEQVTPRKPATAAPSKPIPVSTGVQAAKLITQIKPAYPPLAVSARISGTVRLVAIIGQEGGIRNLQVISGHPLLTQAALDAVRQWRYQPTLLNGEPVEVITQIDVNFTLSR